MLNKILSLFTAGLMVAVAALYQLGQVAAGDAFFIAAAIVVVFTGEQLIARGEMGLQQAAVSIFTQPQSWRSRTAFAAYFTCLALGLFVTAQVLV